MKFCPFGLTHLTPGKHNLKDPRLDEADKLVEAQKKAYAQVDVVEPKELATCDAILTSQSALSDLLMQDLEFVETRLGRDAGAEERAVLRKLAEVATSETHVSAAGLTAHEINAISALNSYSTKPLLVPRPAELDDGPALPLRAFQESGNIGFLTVAGKENRPRAMRAGIS